MFKTPGRTLSLLTETVGPQVGSVIAHIMDASTVEMLPTLLLPQYLPLPLFLPVPITPFPLFPIPAPCTPSPQRYSPGVIPTTRTYSTGKNNYFHGRNSLKTIMVLKKKSMVLIHSTNGSRGLALAVSLHLDAKRGIVFLA